MATIQQLISKLPYRLRARFDSLGSFVQSIVDEQEINTPPRDRLARSDIQTIQLVVFVQFLNFFFLEGTRAAIRAVDEFAPLGVSGFRIGSALFEERNENVMRGETLSESLRTALRDIPELDLSRFSREFEIKPLVIDLLRKANNARSVD